MTKDNIHYNLSKIDGAQRPFNFIISVRGTGKTSVFWQKAYRDYMTKGYKVVVIVRNVNDATTGMLDEIELRINKFLPPDEHIRLYYKQQELQDGVADVRLSRKRDSDVFFRIMALKVKLRKLKSSVLAGVHYFIMDEFIINKALDEKYITGEDFKFKELYNTFWREDHELKAYFFGNAYSWYNPYFSWLGIDVDKVKEEGAFLVGAKWAVDHFKPCQELMEEISQNPVYQDDGKDDYTKYGLGATALNDINIPIAKSQPMNFQLRFVFKTNSERYLYVYADTSFNEAFPYLYWAETMPIKPKNRKITVFGFRELAEGAKLYDTSDKMEFISLRNALRNRLVAFKDLESNYMMEEIYNYL